VTDHRTHPAPRAFSLVEVLIAILVLSLGLLGLGAVFPTILRQQRLATQTTLGLTAQNAAGPILGSNDSFKPGGPGWSALREYVILATGGSDGDWIAVEPEQDNPAHLGSYILPDSTDPDRVFLPLSQRLYPLPYSTEVAPRFVWDIAARITDTADPANSPLKVAVFLRPVDTGIRPGMWEKLNGDRERRSLVTTFLSDAIPLRDRRNPVSTTGKGEPTFDGRRDRSARYATPIVGEIDGPGTGIKDPRLFSLTDVLSPGTDRDVAVALLAQPGQRFIDRNGDVFTIASVDRDSFGGALLTADRPLSIDPDHDENFDFTLINPVIFLPSPSTIEPSVFTINP